EVPEAEWSPRVARRAGVGLRCASSHHPAWVRYVGDAVYCATRLRTASGRRILSGSPTRGSEMLEPTGMRGRTAALLLTLRRAARRRIGLLPLLLLSAACATAAPRPAEVPADLSRE